MTKSETFWESNELVEENLGIEGISGDIGIMNKGDTDIDFRQSWI